MSALSIKKKKSGSDVTDDSHVSWSLVDAISLHSQAQSSKASASSAAAPIYMSHLSDVVAALAGNKHQINSLFVLRRPTNHSLLKFTHHWVLKIVDKLGIITLDFGQSKGWGLVRCLDVNVTEENMSELLMYPERENNTPHKPIADYEVIAQVLPPAFEASLQMYMTQNPEKADYFKKNLGKFLWRWNKKYRSDQLPRLSKINSVAKQLEKWASKTEEYCAVSNNCQRFAYEIFEFLALEHYPQRVFKLAQLLESPYDQAKITKRFGNVSVQEAPQSAAAQPKQKQHKSSV